MQWAIEQAEAGGEVNFKEGLAFYSSIGILQVGGGQLLRLYSAEAMVGGWACTCHHNCRVATAVLVLLEPVPDSSGIDCIRCPTTTKAVGAVCAQYNFLVRAHLKT